MKLKELIGKTAFADVADCLLRIDSNNKACLDAYKTAFDILMRTPAAENDGVITVGWEKKPGKERRLCIRNCESDTWERNLGKEISVQKNVRISESELAARVLCTITFCGINGMDRDEFCKNLSLCHFLTGSALTFVSPKEK